MHGVAVDADGRFDLSSGNDVLLLLRNPQTGEQRRFF